MTDAVILLIISLVAIALMTALPQICCPIYLAIAMMFVMNGGNLLWRFAVVFPAASILFISLMASPLSGSLSAVLKTDVPNKPARLGAHIAAMLCLTYGSFIAMVRWAVSVHENPSFPKVLLVVGVSLLVGFALSLAGTLLADDLFVSKEAEIKKAREEAEQARLAAEQAAKQEAERQRVAAQQEAERQRVAAQQEAEQKRLAAQQKAERKQAEAKQAAERARIAANEAAISKFWDLLVQEYGVSRKMRELGLNGGAIPVDINADIPSVWVRNDERIKTMEDILLSAGFHMEEKADEDMLSGPAGAETPSPYPFASPFLDAVLYSDIPIKLCANKANRTPRTTDNKTKVPRAYMSQFYSLMNTMIDGANGTIKGYLEDYQKEYAIIKSGLMGEYAVQEVLDMHAGAFLVLHDLRLEFPGTPKPVSVETDTLVLAPNGIFAIEVKNYGESGKYKIVVTGDGNWYKEYPARYDGESPKREPMSNPFAQNDRHVAYLERFINELLGRGMENWAHVENIICISNDTVTLENDPAAKQTLTRVSNLYNNITSDRTVRFSVNELNQIKHTLEAKALPGKQYPLTDYSENLKALSQYYNFLLSNMFTTIDAARSCAQDHPEFLTMIK